MEAETIKAKIRMNLELIRNRLEVLDRSRSTAAEVAAKGTIFYYITQIEQLLEKENE